MKYSAGRLIFTKPTICRWWWPEMKLKSKSLPIGQCHMQNAWQGTKGKSPEYRVVAAIRKLRTDTNCPAGKSWPNHVKNEQHIGSEKTYGHWNTEQLNIMMQRTANENAACLRRICKRSDQPKIERLVNNDATLSFIWGHHHLHIVGLWISVVQLNTLQLATSCWRDPTRSKQLSMVVIWLSV